jgi:MtrB/PioB family decaheme-associated outer membrane protein
MRTSTLTLTGALLLISPALAGAQQEAQRPAPTAPAATVEPAIAAGGINTGRVNFGLRGDDLDGDRARYNRFRDLRDGAFLEGFRLERGTDAWAFLGEADNVGYRDQRFSGQFESFGKLKANFTWDQIPLFISADTRSLQRDLGNGVLGVDDVIQQGIQGQTLTLANAVGGATGFDLRSNRKTAAFDATYTANRDVDVILKVKNTLRSGFHLQSFGLLSSPVNGISQELGIPMDTRTTDVQAAVEFANTRGMVSAGVNASWFDNQLPAVRFDNPLRSTDISAGPASGLAAMWPSNSLVSFVANGVYKLPARTRATAAISVGRAEQNEPFVGSTSNTALLAPPLQRANAEGRADVVSMVYGLSSRPVQDLWLNARYRFYDYANKTPVLHAVTITGDWALNLSEQETEPLSVRRGTLDLDASYSPLDYLSVGAGYTREDAERTFRIFEDTAEDTFRVTLDSLGNPYAALRLKYEVSERKGSGFELHLLEAVGEQPGMRHFDVADRDRSRVTGQLTLTPTAWLSVNGSVSRGEDDYKNTGFGLRDNDNRAYGVGFDVVAAETVTLGASYMRERYTANQYSRTANPLPNVTFNDPRRDWWLDTEDEVNTLMASVDFIKTIPKMDIRLSYDLTDGEATYVYGQPADQTVFTTTPLQPLPPVKNKITGARADAQYFLRPNVAIGGAYWYEAYRVQDFAFNPATITPLAVGTSTLYSGYLYRPYTTNAGSVRVTYLW